MTLRGQILPDAVDGVEGRGYRLKLPRGTWFAATPAQAKSTHEWIRTMVVRPDRAAYIAVAELPPEARLSTYDRMKLLMYSRSSGLGRSTDRVKFVQEAAFVLDDEECKRAHIESVEGGIEIECDIIATAISQNYASAGRPLLLIAACAPRPSYALVSEELTAILKSLTLNP